MRLLAVLFCLLSCSLPSLAATDRGETDEWHTDFYWQVALDFSLIQNASNIVGSKERNFGDWANLNLLVDISYKRFFIQSDAMRYANPQRGSKIGLHLYERDDWQFDLIHANYLPGFSEDYAGTVFNKPIAELTGVIQREADGNTGFRFTRTHEDSQLGLDIVADIFDNTHQGWLTELYYTKLLPYRNWDFYLGASITYYSAEVTDYYFSVRPKEVLETRPLYQAGSGFEFVAEAVAQYPLSESWLFYAGIAGKHYSRSIADSPLTRSPQLLQGIVSLRYVF